MTRVILCAVLLGLLGGLLKSFCLVISWAFDPQGQNIYSTLIGLYISQTLFVIPICLTKGLAEQSFSLFKMGGLSGIVTGMISSSVSLGIIFSNSRGGLFFKPWFDSIFITATLLGVSAGVISGFENKRNRRIYILVGLAAGGLASLSHYFTVPLTTGIAFVLSRLSFELSMLFEKLAIYSADGIAQAVIIWCCMAMAENRKLLIRDR